MVALMDTWGVTMLRVNSYDSDCNWVAESTLKTGVLYISLGERWGTYILSEFCSIYSDLFEFNSIYLLFIWIYYRIRVELSQQVKLKSQWGFPNLENHAWWFLKQDNHAWRFLKQDDHAWQKFNMSDENSQNWDLSCKVERIKWWKQGWRK